MDYYEATYQLLDYNLYTDGLKKCDITRLHSMCETLWKLRSRQRFIFWMERCYFHCKLQLNK